MRPISAIVETPESARHWSLECNRRADALISEGRRALLQVSEAEDTRSLQQNRFYWGIVCKEISEQARIEGVQYAPDAWHHLAKRLHLGHEIVRERVAGKKKPVIIRRLKSTRGLSVRAMSTYLEKVLAWAVTDLGVRFSEQRWEDYRS